MSASAPTPTTTAPHGATTPRRLFTIGHGTLPAERFVELLAGRGIRRLVDVRSFPGSRHNPQYGREVMAAWLADAGVTYEWEQRLGGRRRKVTEHSRNVAWRVEAFRTYADWMATEEFRAGLRTLTNPPQDNPRPIAVAKGGSVQHGLPGREAPEARCATSGETAFMCSETVWWRCHRRLLSDHLVLVEHIPVFHLMHDGRVTPHPPMAEARVEDGNVIYDGGEPALGL